MSDNPQYVDLGKDDWARITAKVIIDYVRKSDARDPIYTIVSMLRDIRRRGELDGMYGIYSMLENRIHKEEQKIIDDK